MMENLTHQKFIKYIVESIMDSNGIFHCNKDKLQMINLLYFLADKLDFKGGFENLDLTPEDYGKYFENTYKVYQPIYNEIVLEALEEEEKSNES